jgi:hypothetical protein
MNNKEININDILPVYQNLKNKTKEDEILIELLKTKGAEHGKHQSNT